MFFSKQKTGKPFILCSFSLVYIIYNNDALFYLLFIAFFTFPAVMVGIIISIITDMVLIKMKWTLNKLAHMLIYSLLGLMISLTYSLFILDVWNMEGHIFNAFLSMSATTLYYLLFIYFKD
ncbi:hypothetical protein BALCAV_0219255 [Alkalihalobacillus alcalophilus ATCC 27647 = CGMCC 1.3604]|uniref:Uncharacterized protein n=1 Tax=Alkalihalobacillus alcalophilus ATCC 27647 = CGMCC 1.3604 TaxID=1218173 RepID=A0A094YR52_ALKAL|nr:hypothetical protein BALCAV_0219255 [Alkalihalobacillus alcalophilus ATCC 27647 = CGMCC 1.3604]